MSAARGPAVRAVRAARWEPDRAVREELRRRLRARRRVDDPLARRWRLGTGTAVLDELLLAWERFDEEALAARFDAFEQLDVVFDDAVVRVLHLRGESSDATPIVLTHGWPSTVLELTALAAQLAHPARHGAADAPSFHVVVPALPGFPLSGAPPALREYTGARIADRWVELMAALGYGRFAASGGDIGARVSAWLGARHPERLLGVHLSANALWPSLAGAVGLAPAERAWIEAHEKWTRDEGAYMHLQQTKPLSLAHGLADSPAGLAAWLVEKWHGWGDRTRDVLERFAVDELLGGLTLYWSTNRAATSMLPYAAYDLPPGARPWGGDVTVPASFYLAPHEIGGIPPRSYAERQYTIDRWTELPRGGHFLAVEEPDLLAADIRASFSETTTLR